MNIINSLVRKKAIKKRDKWYDKDFPMLVEHIPSGCVVFLKNRTVGTLVWKPEERSGGVAGTQWRVCCDENYKQFSGTIKLSN